MVYEKKPGFFTIHYVDENGNQIAPSEMKEDTSGEVTFANYKKNIDGYTYWRACYSTANNAEITKAKKTLTGGKVVPTPSIMEAKSCLNQTVA